MPLAAPVQEVPPGRVLIPAALAATAFGVQLNWDLTKEIVMFTAQAVPPPPGTGPLVAGQTEAAPPFNASVFFAAGTPPLQASHAATPCYDQAAPRSSTGTASPPAAPRRAATVPPAARSRSPSRPRRAATPCASTRARP